MKKEYAKPYLVTENFKPQEYCAPCTKPYPAVTTLSDWSKAEFKVFIDLNGDGRYQRGEAFYTTGYSMAPSYSKDQTTAGNVGIYYFELSSGKQNSHSLNIDQTYADHSVGSDQYKIKTISHVRITTDSDAHAFIKTMS